MFWERWEDIKCKDDSRNERKTLQWILWFLNYYVFWQVKGSHSVLHPESPGSSTLPHILHAHAISQKWAVAGMLSVSLTKDFLPILQKWTCTLSSPHDQHKCHLSLQDAKTPGHVHSPASAFPSQCKASPCRHSLRVCYVPGAGGGYGRQGPCLPRAHNRKERKQAISRGYGIYNGKSIS